MTGGTRSAVCIRTLGCDKNTADSSALAGLLRERGVPVTGDPAEAGVVVVNTCGFILPAREESVGAILDVCALKKERPELRILVMGCLAERYGDELRREIPEVDGFLGVHALRDTADRAIRLLHAPPGEADLSGPAGPGRLDPGESFPRAGVLATACLKIADGCSSGCTFCAIPGIKGPYVSRDPGVLVEEARELARGGARELVLVAQDTTAYGQDLPGRTDLSALLERLLEIREFRWIRILYAYPGSFPPDLIEQIRGEPRICRCLDIPFQHGDDGVLRRMGRPHGHRELLEFLETLRGQIPGMQFRSTFITGFPGETPAAFGNLLEFQARARLLWAGAFCYSREDGTPAASLPDPVPGAVARRRRDRFLQAQQEITAGILRGFVGQDLEVLVEEEEGPDLYAGRASFMAPEVDGVVLLQSRKKREPGQFVTVRITDSLEYDLVGEADDSVQ